jgi:exopolysaccharide/PEP-CTERM locus tyrosine autokinase
MSKVQEALGKLRKQKPSKPKADKNRQDGFGIGDERSSIPIARKKKFDARGPKHHVEQEALIRDGLLAPLDHAVSTADEFRRIKRPLINNAIKIVANTEDHMNMILVTSAMPRSGKSFCVINLAVSMSLERELNVVVVDADVLKPHISATMGLGAREGLIDLLLDESRSIEEMLVRTDLNDLQILPAGRRHPQATELLASYRMVEIVEELATRYPDRIILLDSPPLLITNEAVALASQVGQIALVVEAGKTDQNTLRQALELLDSRKAINAILNKSWHSMRIAYRGSEYGYYSYEGTQ